MNVRGPENDTPHRQGGPFPRATGQTLPMPCHNAERFVKTTGHNTPVKTTAPSNYPHSSIGPVHGE